MGREFTIGFEGVAFVGADVEGLRNHAAGTVGDGGGSGDVRRI